MLLIGISSFPRKRLAAVLNGLFSAQEAFRYGPDKKSRHPGRRMTALGCLLFALSVRVLELAKRTPARRAFQLSKLLVDQTALEIPCLKCERVG